MTVAAPTGYQAARESAALIRRERNVVLRLTGTEREEFLDNLCTNRVAGLAAGAGTRAFMLNPTKGRVLADFLAAATDDALLLDCEEGCADTVEELLQRYYFGQDVTIERRADVTVLSLQGPRADATLEAIGAVAPAAVPGSHVVTTMAGVEGRVLRWSETGEPGVRLWVPVDAVDEVERALVEAGAVVASAEAWTLLQIEAGVALFGRELTQETIPLEAPTENAISHDKGCYPGQEVIARLWARGRPARHLRGLRLDAPLAPGARLDADDKPGVARVTASAESPELGAVALAYVQRNYAEPGTALRSGQVGAVVAALPMAEVTV